MFGYYGMLASDVDALYAGLRNACANDPTLHAVAEGCSRHCHGWGYAIHAENGLFHYRTARSIYEDDAMLPKMEGEIRAIFHGRFASDPDLAGHIFSHPFMAANRREVIFLAHNGGVSPERVQPRNVDSEWALEALSRGADLPAALLKVKAHTNSALNLLTLRIGREKGTPASLQYFHYFKSKEADKAAYYKMFEGTMPGGRALVSSTFTLDGGKVGELKNVRAAEFDALTMLG